jgi:aspartate beta-hydroxylase
MSTHALVQRLQEQQAMLREAPLCSPSGWNEAHVQRCAYSWMQLSAHWMAHGDEQRALQAWFQAGQHLPQHWNLQALQVLGLMDERALAQQSADISARRAARLRASFDHLRELNGPASVFRIDRALAGYLGQARVFSSHPSQQPKLLYVPGLSTAGFVDPQSIALARALSCAYALIREEFETALQQGDAHEPFMGRLSPELARRYVSGGAVASWDAIFFDRHGQRLDEVHRRYPNTSAVLDAADRCHIPMQSPETCFSILRPHTRIEPHYGVTNARLVVHLPLKVPPGCYLELVGLGRHAWCEGEVFAFDDTFFHAAENPSDQVRGILLTDAWHPELSAVEREAFADLITTLTKLESAPEWADDSSAERAATA